MADNEESGFNQRTMARRSGQVFWAQNFATVAELKAVEFDLRRQIQMSFVLETLRIYYWDQNSTETGNDDRVVAPTDDEGRWIGFGVLAETDSIPMFSQSTEPPVTGNEGAIWYDTVNKIWRGNNGLDWNSIIGGSSV